MAVVSKMSRWGARAWAWWVWGPLPSVWAEALPIGHRASLVAAARWRAAPPSWPQDAWALASEEMDLGLRWRALSLGAPANAQLPWPCQSTLLHRAAVRGHPRWAQALVAAGADLESLDARGLTPLGQALSGLGRFSGPWEARRAVVKQLLASGARADGLQWEGRFSTLMLCPFDVEVFEWLVAAGADPHATDANGQGLLARVCDATTQDGIARFLSMLVRLGWEPARPDATGHTLLDYTATRPLGPAWRRDLAGCLTVLESFGVNLRAALDVLAAAPLVSPVRGWQEAAAWGEALVQRPDLALAGLEPLDTHAEGSTALEQLEAQPPDATWSGRLIALWRSAWLGRDLPAPPSRPRPRL